MPLGRQYPVPARPQIPAAAAWTAGLGHRTAHGARHSGRLAFLAGVTLTFGSSPLTVADENSVSVSLTAGRAT